MSSTTTYTMAPAAKASAYGRIGTIMATRAAPRRPAMGSTRPESCPYQMAFAVEQPAALRGKDTATPSGKFWMPIPSARFLADSKVADFVRPIAPKPTPTARPSGMLCTVTATIRRRIRLQCSSFLFLSSISKFSMCISSFSALLFLSPSCELIQEVSPLSQRSRPGCSEATGSSFLAPHANSYKKSPHSHSAQGQDAQKQQGPLSWPLMRTHTRSLPTLTALKARMLRSNRVLFLILTRYQKSCRTADSNFGHQPICSVHKKRPEEESCGDGKKNPLSSFAIGAKSSSHFQGRLQKRPVGRCKHHPGSETEADVEQFSLLTLQKHGCSSSQGCQAPCEQGALK